MIRILRKSAETALIAAAWLCFALAMIAVVADCAKTLALSHITFTSAAALLTWADYAPANPGVFSRIVCAMPVWLIFSLAALLLYAVAAGEFSLLSLRSKMASLQRKWAMLCRESAAAQRHFRRLIKRLKTAKRRNPSLHQSLPGADGLRVRSE